MSVAIIGDLHLGARGGDPVMMDFQLGYLRRFVDGLKRRGITKVIQAGDFFDVRKQMNVLLMYHVVHTITPIFREAGIKVLVINGNHDIFYRDSNHIDSNLLLEVAAPDVFHIVRENEELTIDGERWLLMGWINKQNMAQQIEAARNSTADFLVAHLALTGFAMYKGVPSHEGMPLDPFKHFKRVYTGHYHTISQHQNVVYVGAPYHLTWADYPDGTMRGWWIHDEDGSEPTLVQNQPSDSLFTIEQYNPDAKYDEAMLAHCTGRIVKFVVDEVKEPRLYKKFLSVVSGLSMVDYKIIDNTVKQAGEMRANISEEVLTTSTPTVLTSYIDKMKEEGIIKADDAEGVKAKAMELYTRASK